MLSTDSISKILFDIKPDIQRAVENPGSDSKSGNLFLYVGPDDIGEERGPPLLSDRLYQPDAVLGVLNLLEEVHARRKVGHWCRFFIHSGNLHFTFCNRAYK